MSDLSLCNGIKKYLGKKAEICPLRESCWRYHAPVGTPQSWIAAPFIGKACDHWHKMPSKK